MSGVGCINSNANSRRGTCKMMNTMAMPSPTVSEFTNRRITSDMSRRPRACEVMPLVPMRRKPNSQYSRLKIIEPTAIAPI